MKNPISLYFNWLQKDVPTGLPEKYPEINEHQETSVPGVFVSGDLTGTPLLKLGAENGAQIVNKFMQEPSFTNQKGKSSDVYDVIIVGGGPAGIAAALECEKHHLNYILLESSQLFNTIENFPKGKHIIAEPTSFKQRARLLIQSQTKEKLIISLHDQIKGKDLNISLASDVKAISKEGNSLLVKLASDSKKALRVILAIGKSGNARALKVPGENLPKVYNKVYDPTENTGKNILVVGGGDTSIEASIDLARSGNFITHSYRKPEFSRPKQENLDKFESLVKEGKIKTLFNSKVLEITEDKVKLATDEGEKTIVNDMVYVLVGRELPFAFFKRSKIKMEGEKPVSWYVFLVAMVSFFTMLYFGKSGFAHNIFAGAESFGETIKAYLTGPFQITSKWGLKGYAWYASLNFYLGWLGSMVWLITGTWSLLIILQQPRKYFGSHWHKIKYGYFIGVAVFFTYIYFTRMLMQNKGWVESPTFWYSLLYCTTMVIFGIRRMQVKKTRYIRRQTLTLIFIQVFFLFLVPFYLYDAVLLKIFEPGGLFLSEVFPQGKWQSFGFILFWPLTISYFGTSTFWTWFPFVQTFGILFLLVKLYGKGAYCGWICSCGGMAETLGDEYRSKSPHGPKAKKLENIGQVVLVWIFVATALHYFVDHKIIAHTLWNDVLWGTYKITIDVFFAGVLGLGVYFFMGGRVWCRYGCPLAALMHIYTRFSNYRILSEKKNCISCNTCTKVCHMGIDVMNFANKGIPMNDVECVRCSSCVQSCPTEVLSFAKVGVDPDNKSREFIPPWGKESWKSGIH